MPIPIKVEPLENYRLWVKYSDGVEGIVDLSDLAGKGVFALWNDYREFQKVYIGPSGEIAWSDQVDLCPDATYLKITGKQPEDIFPKLRELVAYARN
ncbi:MAG: DUF2442 domain-containing protein [Anaerolineales bacterium]|nr:MAG: DUF2442 domain-containing protein [Anaerolineales bacterium]